LRRKLRPLAPGLICAVLLVLLVGDLTLIESLLPPEAQTIMKDAEGNTELAAPFVVAFAIWLWRGNSRDR
jgi:hypothetical protein